MFRCSFIQDTDSHKIQLDIHYNFNEIVIIKSASIANLTLNIWMSQDIELHAVLTFG